MKHEAYEAQGTGPLGEVGKLYGVAARCIVLGML